MGLRESHSARVIKANTCLLNYSERCATQCLCHQLNLTHRHDRALICHVGCVMARSKLFVCCFNVVPVSKEEPCCFIKLMYIQYIPPACPALKSCQHRAIQLLLPRAQDHLQYAHTNTIFIIHLQAMDNMTDL